MLFQRRKENRWPRTLRGNNKRSANKRKWANQQQASLGTQRRLEPVRAAALYSLSCESTSSSIRYFDALVDEGVGWECLNNPKNHVAPVCHPLGLPLLRLLNDGDIDQNSIMTNEGDYDELGGTLRAWINQFKRLNKDDDRLATENQKRALERLLQGIWDEAMNGKTGKIMSCDESCDVEEIGTIFKRTGHLVIDTEWNGISDTNRRRGSTSMVLSEKSSSNSAHGPVPRLLLQCGFVPSEFRVRNFLLNVKQGIDNLKILVKQTCPDDVSDLALLLVVATLEKDASDAAAAATTKLVGRIGVWLCWSAKTVDFDNYDESDARTKRSKMTFLWRDETDNVTDMAQALVKCHDAAVHLAQWQSSSSDRSCMDDFDNLGPNCSVYRLDGKVAVARSYDSRWRDTYRSPSFYLNTDISTEATKDSTTIMLFKDKNYNVGTDDEEWPPLDFGVDLPDRLHLDWMWQFQGKLQVIATPFIEGAHDVNSPSVVDDLFQLTKAGYVHGDIRFFNMTFGDERGHIIDYDMCGKQGDKRYPRGYQFALEDGVRSGRAEAVIEFRHDWKALWSVLSAVYRVISPDAETNYQRHQLESFFLDNFTTGSLQAHVEMLKTFILRCPECKPNENMSELLLLAKRFDLSRRRATTS